MAKWLVVVESNCADPSREEEFNTWYNTVHLPDVLETPGVVRAIRYERLNPSEGQGKYVAVYDVDADDLQAVLQDSQKIIAEKEKQGRMSDLLHFLRMSSLKEIHRLTQ